MKDKLLRGRRRCGLGSPDDESSPGLQQLPLTTESLEQVDHELVEVGIHGGGRGRAPHALGSWKVNSGGHLKKRDGDNKGICRALLARASRSHS